MTEPAGEDRRMVDESRAILSRFLEEPGGHVLLDHEYKVIDCGPEYLRLTKARRENVMGKHIFDTLTETNPERQAHVVGILRSALQRAGETLEVEKTSEFRCDVREQAPGARSEERWWRVAVVPLSRDGHVEYNVLRVEDFTVPIVTKNALDANRKSNYVLYALVCIILGVSIYFDTQATNRIKRNSARTSQVAIQNCTIQKQLLPGQRILASVMGDINQLLLTPRVATGPRPSPRTLQIVARMESDLQQYLTITHNLPQTRFC